ncbi:MAG TPA: hypothetical protein VGE18_02995 [Candidatus Paceibacterota bacterium]
MKKFFTSTGLFLLSILLLGFFKKEEPSEQQPVSEPDSTKEYTGEAAGELGIGA